MPDSQNQTAIIGAGPAGLAVARALKTLDLPFRVFERHHDVGGIWDRTLPGSPMYRSAHFISSKTTSAFPDYPMPEDYPDYPSNTQILSYLRQFAKAHDLYPDIQFNIEVSEVTPKGDCWQITTANGYSQTYRWLVCANGTNWHPNRPSLKGEETFPGEIIHSVCYDDDDALAGKRVLIVGGGNSGVDIACDAAKRADKAFISLRRGYHFVPKHLFGMPADVFGAKTGGGPMWLEQPVFSGILRLLNGDLTRLGLQKPDHRVLSSHPILNSQILHYLQHGDLTAKRDVSHLEGALVHFVDGSEVEVDMIILATGFHWNIPYLDESCFDWQNHRPQLYLHIFSPKHDNLFVNGFLETNSSAYPLFDEMADLIARTIASQHAESPDATTVAKIIQEPTLDLSGKISFVNSERHTGYANKDTYIAAMKKFRKRVGWPELKPGYYASCQQTKA